MAAESNGNGWKTAAISALGGALLLLAGWTWSGANDTSRDIQQRIQAVQAETKALSERVATQEEATRNIREALQRIENGINEMRQDRRR